MHAFAVRSEIPGGRAGWPPPRGGSPPGGSTAGLPGTPGAEGVIGDSPIQVRVLGPAVITGAVQEPQPKQAELVFALALYTPPGLTWSDLATKLGRDADHPKPPDILRQLITRTRRRLGGPGGGGNYITYHGLARRYTLADVWLDWAAFTALAGRGRQAESRADLRAALDLVRGEPFDGVYFWWLEQATLDAMRAQVTDTAELLARLELGAGDPSASARAARAGLTADPAFEPLWRALMAAEAAAGNTVGVHRAWRHLRAAIADITPGGAPHPDTVALYRDLTRERAAGRGRLTGPG
jgi:DNA-binding SARP family transcriptional activator